MISRPCENEGMLARSLLVLAAVAAIVLAVLFVVTVFFS